jgi:hypothetical protein
MADEDKSKSPLGYIMSLLGGAAVAALIGGYFNQRLETRKFESAIIQSAVAQEDEDKRIRALTFLLDMKLIRNEQLVADLRDAIQARKVPQFAPPAAPPVIVQPPPVETPTQWGALFGGYKTLPEAQQVQERAIKEGFAGTAIYKNGPLFELATPYESRAEAQRAAETLKQKHLSGTPLVINISRWCPNPIPREGYFEGNPKENKYLNP